jgi:hypothetical protein
MNSQAAQRKEQLTSNAWFCSAEPPNEFLFATSVSSDDEMRKSTRRTANSLSYHEQSTEAEMSKSRLLFLASFHHKMIFLFPRPREDDSPFATSYQRGRVTLSTGHSDAQHDAFGKKIGKKIWDALLFFLSGDFDDWCDIAGYEPDWLLKLAARTNPVFALFLLLLAEYFSTNEGEEFLRWYRSKSLSYFHECEQ